jgi:hypothetical protein
MGSLMAHPLPPSIEAAQTHLLEALQKAGVKTDPLKTPWPDIEKGAIKLFGGPFKPDQPEHQGVALGLAAVFAARLIQEHGAFWFPNRESIEGGAVGFPEALIVLSPFSAVADALSQAKLARLDDIAKDIRTSLAKTKFSPAAGGPQRLEPIDYQRLFDPGFLQFVRLDPAKAKSTWESTPDKLAREIRDALNRASKDLPAEAKGQLEQQLVGALQRMEQSKSLGEQIERAPRVAELMVHLFATVDGSGAAPSELWEDIVLPLLHIGVPAQMPPLDEDELEVAKKGVDPLFLFLDVVPYATPAPEDGMLGAFKVDELQFPHPNFQQAGSLRMIKLKTDRIKPLLDKLDPPKTQNAVERFAAHVKEKSGVAPQAGGEGPQLLAAALALLQDLKRVISAGGEICLRRTTEAEAASEGAMNVVRKALQGPKIILTP